jgi:hypothetical protein
VGYQTWQGERAIVLWPLSLGRGPGVEPCRPKLWARFLLGRTPHLSECHHPKVNKPHPFQHGWGSYLTSF